MLLEKIFAYQDQVKKHQNLIKIILSIIPLFFCSFKKTKINDVVSREPPLTCIDISLSSKINNENFFLVNNRFKLNNHPLRQTIRIYGKEEQKEKFYLLISSIKDIDFKGINIIFDFNEPSDDLTIVDLHVVFDTSEPKVTGYSFASKQPNSELLAIAKYHFPLVPKFDLKDFFYNRFNKHNVIHITINESLQDMKSLLRLIKVMSYIRNHPYGNYFYIPLQNCILDLVQMAPFAALVFLYYFFDCIIFNYDVSLIRIFIGATSFYLFPFTFIFFLFRKNEWHCFIFIFMIFNQSLGFIFTFFCYLNSINNTIKLIIANRKNLKSLVLKS